ncbi:1-phosphofructokinase [Microbacterium terricola]|uniref:1-phosphofructokinase n=1 Tax=Microbacterium terricola TaxID=344163 RepID=A0ABM8DZE5_9MICO|nr:1-phosphofructokinase [Microbacterium terricola]UYK41326.1 1-phosphofructokinase [Microbacterium terricola]BDV30891.1 1-phosphofructokinase [Microbacterium terricola]
MIVTLTANPSLDRTIVLADVLRPGDVQAAAGSREDAGGKGINVSRVVAAAGIPTLAVLPLADDDPFDAAVRHAGVPALRVPVAGLTRANVTITDPAGTTTKLNLAGATLDAAEATAVIDAVVAASADADWLVLAGSLPPGAGDDFYVRVVAAVRAAGHTPRIAVDASGPALRAVVEHAHVDLIKPNDEELAELAGVDLRPDEDAAASVLAVARGLVPDRVAAALVTLGAAGAVLVTAEGAWQGSPPPIEVASTVGAGDSSLAGYLLAEVAGAPAPDRLRSAIRYGAAAASLPGTQAPTPSDLPSGDVPVRALAHRP